MIAAATGLVLLTTCVNVAGLLLARSITRRRESAVRAALGAGRGRATRVLMTECILLSAAGGAVGLAVAFAIVRAVPALAPATSRLRPTTGRGGGRQNSGGLCGRPVRPGRTLSGVAPALRWSRSSLARDLTDGGQTTGGVDVRGRPARAALVAMQVAVTVTLLVGAGLLLPSFVRLVTVDPGFDRANVVTIRVGNASDLRESSRGGFPGRDAFDASAAANRRFYDALIQRVSRLSGVDPVGLFNGSRRRFRCC